ncbi:glycerophosphodiester phosphodiesterase [bacterium]|jgi:glycerophosphoryl diester phosphodiesterase|nr:glycerophosphodiester phosphodiesterase [Planctomicrobium sp.]MDB4731451.1 glycerophosphodiester phosphodiesterase [bacterium]
MRIFLQSLLSCLILFCATSAQGQFVVAHRGASHAAPENTLAAFKLAWEEGADGIEGDFYLSKDGQVVCIHDKDTKRVSPNSEVLKVAEATFDELRALDVGIWKDEKYADEQIPTLVEVLATIPEGKKIFVEIKCGPEIVPVIKPQLAASGLKPEQIVIICFNEAVIKKSRELMPEYKASWLTSYKQETKTSPWQPSTAEVLTSLERTGATGLGTNGNLAVIDKCFVDAIRDAGIEFHVWTVNGAVPALAFKSLGVDSITTDQPKFIRETIEAKVE